MDPVTAPSGEELPRFEESIAELLGLPGDVVHRVLEEHLHHSGELPPEPRYLALYRASHAPATTPRNVRRILQVHRMLLEVERYREGACRHFLYAGQGGGGGATTGEAEVEGPEGLTLRRRQRLLEAREPALQHARSRRDVDDLLAEVRWLDQAQQLVDEVDPGLAELAEALWGSGADGPGPARVAESLAGEACRRLGSSGTVVERAIEVQALRVAACAGLRQELRQLLAQEGILACRPSHARPEAILPARLATTRRAVPDLSPHEVRCLHREASEAGIELRIEVEPSRVLEVAHRHDPHGEAPRSYPEVVETILQRAVLDRLLPVLAQQLLERLVARAHRREVEAVGEAYHHRLDAIPVAEEEVLAVDPGYASGCRLATVDRDGDVVDHGTFELIGAGMDPEQTNRTLRTLLADAHARTIAVGVAEGHQELVRRLREAVEDELEDPPVEIHLVDGLALDAAAGAPPLKAQYRGADHRLRRVIVIGRRLLDPFRAWSEVDPRAIAAAYSWTGLDASALARQLDEVLRDEIALRGVDLNTCPEPLLARIPGLDRTLASTLVRHRQEHGPFTRLEELEERGLLDPVTWERVAGFLSLFGEEVHPVDRTTVHPQDRELASRLLELLPLPLEQLQRQVRSRAGERIDIQALAAQAGTSPARAQDLVGKILGHAWRQDADRDLVEESAGLPDDAFEELIPGMEVRGTVGDIVSYGAFVDVGDGAPALLHISELAERYVPDPRLIVETGDEVVARVISVEEGGSRVALSLRRDSWPGKVLRRESGGSARRSHAGREARTAGRGGCRPQVLPGAAARVETDEVYPRVGDILEGQVQRVVEYGAFIEFGLRRAGLLHRTQIDPQGAIEPHEVLAAGDRVTCRVIESSPERGRIGLSMLGVEPGAEATYYALEPVPTGAPPGGDLPRLRGSRRGEEEPPRIRTVSPRLPHDEPVSFEELRSGMVVHGRVTKTVSYGIFVDLGIDAPALIHISEIADVFVRNPGALVRPGDRVRVHVLRVNREERSIALTLRREDGGLIREED